MAQMKGQHICYCREDSKLKQGGTPYFVNKIQFILLRKYVEQLVESTRSTV